MKLNVRSLVYLVTVYTVFGRCLWDSKNIFVLRCLLQSSQNE